MTARGPRCLAAPRLAEPSAVVGAARNEGHGKRLTAAFEALEGFPALAESRTACCRLSPRSAPRPATW